MKIENIISKKLNIPQHKVKNTIDLLIDQNTIPFIARYRKELTGNLDEIQIREIKELLSHLENLEKRRQIIIKSIEESGKLTDDLKKKIQQAGTITRLEDLYQPYRPKRKTRATAAREKGLEPLAELILSQTHDSQSIKRLVEKFINDLVPGQEEALAGASDIIAEVVSDNPEIRQQLRQKMFNNGKVVVINKSDGDDERRVYQDYYQFNIPVNKLRHYQTMAINRGEREKILTVNLEIEEHLWKRIIYSQYPLDNRSKFQNILASAIEDGARRLLLPSIIRDVRRDINEVAETHAIKVFAENLRSLLTQPPISGCTILGIDPGFRTGCKVAVIDPNGKLVDQATIYPHPPQNQLEQAYSVLLGLVKHHQVSLIVIGNGTASRETEAFIAEITKKDNDLNYLITSEAGASVYSASDIAREEFPDLDVSMRGAVSIARRVQDPLAELIKIDPRSIGVGLYQHDVDQSKLSQALDQVIESVVNTVGVEINTASKALLSHISGIGSILAQRIVAYREETGAFSNREEIKNVPGIGPKTFQQAAGFLRIRNSDNPLDNTGVHPENYPLVQNLLSQYNIPVDISPEEISERVSNFLKQTDLDKLAKHLDIGTETLKDIFEELANPGRDPRDSLPKPILRNDVLTMDDLSPGMEIKGTIRNIVDFGAFVDIGVKIDGLLHRSKIPKNCKLKVGDVIELKIKSIDTDRNRIALSMKETFDK